MLGSEEQDEAFERIHRLRVDLAAGTDSEAARFIRSMRGAAGVVGRNPTIDDYKKAYVELAGSDEPIETYSRVYRYFGTWPLAREALELSESSTPRRIEARFRERRLGKVWRWTEDALRDTLLAAAEHWGRPPTTQEFDWWRHRELELARATGNSELNLPSTGPFRKRFDTWENALLHFGFTPEQVASRLEGKAQPFNAAADPYLPADLPVAHLTNWTPEGLPLDDEEVERVRVAYDLLARRSQYVLTARLGLGIEPLTLKAACKPLGLHLSRVNQLQVAALRSVADAVAGEGRRRPDLKTLLDPVETVLKALALTPGPARSTEPSASA